MRFSHRRMDNNFIIVMVVIICFFAFNNVSNFTTDKSYSTEHVHNRYIYVLAYYATLVNIYMTWHYVYMEVFIAVQCFWQGHNLRRFHLSSIFRSTKSMFIQTYFILVTRRRPLNSLSNVLLLLNGIHVMVFFQFGKAKR